MKELIILAIASRNETYDQFVKNYWYHIIKYVKQNHTNIKIFLLYGNSNIDDFDEIKDNIIKSEYDETFPNILEKTLDAFEFVTNKYKYDYIFRTNLSTFTVIEHIQSIINMLPETFIGGTVAPYENFKFIGGMGILISKDIIQNMIENRKLILNKTIDDVDIGKYLYGKYNFTNIKRLDIVCKNYLFNEENLNMIYNTIISNKFFFIRIKNNNRKVDIQVLTYLTNKFYNNLC